MTQDTSHATFTADVLNSDTPVLVDFWAPWCGPCRLIAPVLESIGEDHPEIKIVKLNIDDNPEEAIAYQVMSIPTMMVFKGGEAAKTIVGAKSKALLLEDLSEFLVTEDTAS